MYLPINENPLQETHVAWHTKLKNDKITLYETVQCEYPHPEAPINIKTYELRAICTVKNNSSEAGSLLLLQANQIVITQLIASGVLNKDKKEKK